MDIQELEKSLQIIKYELEKFQFCFSQAKRRPDLKILHKKQLHEYEKINLILGNTLQEERKRPAIKSLQRFASPGNISTR